MGERLALKRSYGEIGWPKGFKPVKDHHRALVEFLELHKNEFAHISFGDIDDYDDLKRLIQKKQIWRLCCGRYFYWRSILYVGKGRIFLFISNNRNHRWTLLDANRIRRI